MVCMSPRDKGQLLTNAVVILLINAIAILSEDRFLARSTSLFTSLVNQPASKHN